MTDFEQNKPGKSRFQSALIAAGPLPVVAVMGGLALGVMGLSRSCSVPRASAMHATVADLSPVHTGIDVAGKSISALTRLAAGDSVKTDGDGRARIRLDDGTTYIVDRNTRLTIAANGGVSLAEGRVFAQSPTGAKSELAVSDLKVSAKA